MAMQHQERSNYYSRPMLSGIELLHAGFVRHAFARHSHDYYVIGLVERGVQRFWHDRETLITPTLGVIALNPGEPHTGEAAIETGFLYRAMYPSATLMASITEELTGASGLLPAFKSPRIDDDRLARRLLQTHDILIRSPSQLKSEESLLETLFELVSRHADRSRMAKTYGNERQATRRAREYIESNFSRDVSLTELATVAELSPYHLTRVFRAETGLPPHAFLESVRIREAQRLIRAGQPLAAIAHDVGFTDQSHFTHRFRRMVGVTPGRFALGFR
jgi:AraC-like DNA-binding protein